MASLVQRKNGTYSLVWTDSSRTKRQVRESLKTDDKKRAELKQKELEWKYAEGDHDPWENKWYERSQTDHILLNDAISQYLKFKRNAKGKQGWSYRRYNSVAPSLKHFAELTGNIPVQAVTEQHLENYYYRPKVNSSHTRRTYRINLITFFKWCQRKGYITDYPDHELKPTTEKTPKFIYPDELAQLIQWKINDIEKYIKSGETQPDLTQLWHVYGWMILASSGMRPSELVRLKTHHIGRGFIDIGEDFEVKNAVQRRIPLLYEAPHAIQILLSMRESDRLMKKNNYLFGRHSDMAAKRLSKEFTRGWNKLFERKRTLYNLKDFFAVRFLTDPNYGNQTHRLYELQQILGHKTITSTEKYLKSIPYGVTIEGTIWDTDLSVLTGGH